MFVLVRRVTVVHNDYPWIIPFWVQLVGFPLHLWTDANLRNIGGRIGNVDTVELTEGHMLIHVDSRRPLQFSRKVEYKGDEVTLEIKYDMLFKHCSTCGMLSHEKGQCPTLDIRSRIQLPERQGVFTRVQAPQEQFDSQNSNRDPQRNAQFSHQSSVRSRNLQLPQRPTFQASRQNASYDTRDSR